MDDVSMVKRTSSDAELLDRRPPAKRTFPSTHQNGSIADIQSSVDYKKIKKTDETDLHVHSTTNDNTVLASDNWSGILEESSAVDGEVQKGGNFQFVTSKRQHIPTCTQHDEPYDRSFEKCES